MRDVTKVLGWVVAGALATACGGSVDQGTIKGDGTKTPTDRVQKSDGCGTYDEWSYQVDDGVSCEAAQALVEQCNTKVCGDATASCYAYTAAGKSIFEGGGEGFYAKCAQGGAPPAVFTCRANYRRTGCAVEGRRPDGLHAVHVDPYVSVASYFANAAHLEAAAVLAFERLERELREQGAPPALLGRLRRAAREERRHVEIASKLARSFGAEPLEATAEPFEWRSLYEIARENVVEGVVRETYGAAVALFRAERAESPEVRASLSEIAHDECRHAQLSWDLHAWMWSWLGEAERKHVEAARIAAIEELRESLRAEPAEELATIVGVPRAAEALELFEGLFANAWKRAA